MIKLIKRVLAHWTVKLLGVIVVLLAVFYLYLIVNDIPLLTVEESPPLPWQEVAHELDIPLKSVVFAQNQFVAVGNDGLIITSRDGEHWQRQESGTSWHLEDIVYTEGTFTVVGERGTVLRSTDGYHWKTVDAPTRKRLKAIAYGNDRYVVLADREVILTSTDGVQWTNLGVQAGYAMDALIFRHGRFIIMGAGSSGITSTDGRHWDSFEGEKGSQNLKLVPGNEVRRITFGNEIFAATAGGLGFDGYGLILTSDDGLDWQRVVRFEDTPFGIIYDGGRFVAVGNQMVLTSRDGADWQSYHFDINNGLRDVAYGNGRYVAVGFRGLILVGEDLDVDAETDASN